MPFISDAYAQEMGVAAPVGGAPGAPQSPVGSFLPLILIFIVFYFFLIRPQQKRFKEHKLMTENLKRGDRIVTGGGIIGKITKVIDDDLVEAEIAPDVRVEVARATVTSVMNKSDDVTDEKQEKATDDSSEPKKISKSKAARKQKIANDN